MAMFGAGCFVQLSSDGKLQIWNTLSNSFEDEFSPNFSLSAYCTCLQIVNSNDLINAESPRKKRRKSGNHGSVYVVLGTSSGLLLLYSLTTASQDSIIESNTRQAINCLTNCYNGIMYAGTDSNILVWNLAEKTLASKWSSKNEKITSILYIPSCDKLLTASKQIKLWDIQSQEILKVYPGHSTQITLLHYINQNESEYFLSGSKGDRLLSCWSLNEDESTNVVGSFLMEDIVQSVSSFSGSELTSIAAVLRNGVVHLYQFSGKSSKPIKPKTTLQVISDSKEETVTPMHITAVKHRGADTLCIRYGISVGQVFEDISISTNKKLLCLLRENTTKNDSRDVQISKVKAPIVGNDVHYLTPAKASVAAKRRNDGQQELPMEKRLENLMIRDSDPKIPKANNFAQLLIQGLHSKDKSILRTIFMKNDEQLIKNTIKRIPVTVVVPLLEELSTYLQGKTMARKIGVIWMKYLILEHAAFLISNPDLSQIFANVLSNIEALQALQAPRVKLIERLELLVTQIDDTTSFEHQDEKRVLVFNDKVESDSDGEVMEFDLESNSGEE